MVAVTGGQVKGRTIVEVNKCSAVIIRSSLISWTFGKWEATWERHVPPKRKTDRLTEGYFGKLALENKKRESTFWHGRRWGRDSSHVFALFVKWAFDCVHLLF